MKRTLLMMFLVLALCSCTAQSTPELAPTLAATPTAAATLTPEPIPSPSPDAGPPVSHAMADMTGFDFAARLCSAIWSNNGINIPCPGQDLSNAPDGYVALYDGAELGVKPGIPVVLTYPAQHTFEGIFGRFPAYTVQQGDQFYTHVDCLPRALCYVEFGLEYYDASGAYHSGFAAHPMHGADPIEEFIVDLSSLAGQTVELVLVVRVHTRQRARSG
jgi:hypothetical protein